MSGKGKAPAVVPKEEEEDMDDLDDVLEEFSKPEKESKVIPAPTASGKSVPDSKPNATVPVSALTDQANEASEFEDLGDFDDMSEEDKVIAAELAKGMTDFMMRMQDASKSSGKAESQKEGQGVDEMDEQALMDAFAQALALGGAGSSAAPAKKEKAETSAEGKSKSKAKGTASGGNFQGAIKQTQERLKTSSENATAEADASADPLAAYLAAFADNADPSELGDINHEEMSGLIMEKMMESLTSKDVLYEPLKELSSKYPTYLSSPAAAGLSQEDRTRYIAQDRLVKSIVAKFEDPAYSEDDKEKAKEIVELMNEMQSHGAPPSDIMGGMPPEMQLGPDGLPILPEDCVIC